MQYRRIAVLAVIIMSAVLCTPTSADMAWPGPRPARPVAVPTEPGAANPSQLVGSPCVRMAEATVDIDVKPNQHKKGTASIGVNVKAVFHMCSDSVVSETMTVGFPLSNHSYSAAKLGAFSVNSNGEAKSLSRWPEQTSEKGKKSEDKRLREATERPPAPVPEPIPALPKPAPAPAPKSVSEPPKPAPGPVPQPTPVPRPMPQPNPDPLRDMDADYANTIARETYNQNMMAWEEAFAPKEERIINVQYQLDIASQLKGEVATRVKKMEFYRPIPLFIGLTPIDLSCISRLLNNLPDGRYYLFDYFLVSGATWKGPIGKETIRLHLSDDFKGMQVLCSQPDRLKQENPTTWTYVLENEKPRENLYFALPAKGK